MSNAQLLLADSLNDLKYDFEELLYLVDHFLLQLKKISADLIRVKRSIRPESYKLIEQEVIRISKRLGKYKRQIIDNIEHRTKNIKQITKLENEKKIYFDLIRTQAGVIGSLITSLDWQSPSFINSQYSQAGKQEGKIKGTINDYKRDTHLDEEWFEKAYVGEYIDAPLKFGIKAYLTSSGMSAFTTIFNFLLMEGKLTGKILLGKSSYFQYKQLLVQALRERIIEIDESDTGNIIKTIQREKPSAIFLDSLCNASDIPTPHLTTIINFLIKNYKKDISLVIDNTGLSVTFQPFKKTGKLRIILFESLMKYIHFGLDRVTGGIIVAARKDCGKIFEYRKHLGTNIPDASVYAFPTPNRVMLEKRLKRLGRNAYELANSLQKYINNHKNCLLEKIVYPRQDMLFAGSFFNLSFKKKSVRLYKRFISTVISEAKRQNVDLVGGTSFGLNTTRIYLTSLWTKYGKPFVRVSVGTENKLQLEALKKVFITALNKLSRFPINL